MKTVSKKEKQLLELGRHGNTTLEEVVKLWSDTSNPKMVVNHLYRLHKLYGHAFLVDGAGRFHIFKK